MNLEKIHHSWIEKIGGEFQQPYMHDLKKFLQAEEDSGAVIFPDQNNIFNALNTTHFNNVRVVIIGQDPYHGDGQAHGLSFSVPRAVRVPPSLMNIYKELESEYAANRPDHGDLTGWAEQGVLLLNATLTVRRDMAGSHQKKGWENFTDAVIRALNDHHENIVFLLWGSYAQKKGQFIDRAKHCVLTAPHPSPLSAHRGFLGCGHFKAANEYLQTHGLPPIIWLP